MKSGVAIGPAAVALRAKKVLFSQQDDELLAIDAESGFCYSLNESAGRIWQLIESPQTVQALCDQLCIEYTIDTVTCLRDVAELLAELRANGLVEIHAAAPA